MNTHEIIFAFNGVGKIIYELNVPIEEANCCTGATSILVYGTMHYALGFADSLRYEMRSLFGALKLALEGELRLHPSITRDIGYLYNEYFQRNGEFVYEERGGRRRWVGERYNVWGGRYPLWIYNNDDGDIVFEMTPSFPGDQLSSSPGEELDPGEVVNRQWYEEWIKDYKPIFIQKMPRSVAQQWLDQADHILDVIEANVKKMYRDRVIEFPINEIEDVMAVFDDPVALVHPGAEANITVNIGRHGYLLSTAPIYYNMKTLSDLLSGALNHTLQLPDSFIHGPGYLYNEMLNDGNSLKSDDAWLLGRCMWAGGDVAAWIYNDNDGNIVFEVAPIFSKRNSISAFNEWMCQYKPILVRKLPRARAEKWLEQARWILEKVKVSKR